MIISPRLRCSAPAVALEDGTNNLSKFYITKSYHILLILLAYAKFSGRVALCILMTKYNMKRSLCVYYACKAALFVKRTVETT